VKRRAAHNGELVTRVNVVPIIDVALVLVIILLVTAPLMSTSDLPVNLPAAHTREAEDERNVSITIGTNGELAVDEQLVARTALRAVLAARLARATDENVLVVLRADVGTPFAEVRRTLDEARAAGAKRLAIATRQSTEERR
jgi:biopolymer transport protein ExbD